MALTPQQIEENRAKLARRRDLLKNKLSLSSFDTEKLTNSIPNNLKPQGSQRLPSLFLNQGTKILSKVVPSLTDLIDKWGIADLELNPNNLNIEALKQQYCPTTEELDKIILQRNNLVNYLNNIGQTLDNLTITVEFGAGIGNLLQGLINVLKTGKTASQIALSFLPIAPGLATSLIDKVGDLADTLTFNEDGTPRLPPITITASQVSPAIAVTQSSILKSVALLQQVDYLVTLCNPYATLTETSKTINDLAENELLAEVSNNDTTYKGFVIEIETKKYTDTVNQNRAVGKNKSGIVLIATEYSFASNPNVLIDELKFIIDRDDLKAY